MTHHLEEPWTFYYYSTSHAKKNDVDYSQCIKKIAKVSTVEEFWAVYSHTLPPSKLKPNCALHFFRGDSRAMREDKENENGGTFFIRLKKGHASQAWEKLLLEFIGGNMHPDLIGAVVSVKTDIERIMVWNQTSNNPQLRIDIVNSLGKCLNLPFKSRIEYLPHIRETVIKPIAYILENEGAVEQQK